MSETLKLLRQKKQMKQEEVAEKVGITQAAYSQFELGQTKPRTIVRKKLEALFGQPIQDLASTRKKKKKLKSDGYIYFNVPDARLIQRALYWYVTEISDRVKEREKDQLRFGKRDPNIFMTVFKSEQAEAERVHKLLKEKLDELEEL